MTATTAILSLVIIVLCGSLIYMYFFGTAKIKPSDIVDLVDYKIKLNQLSNRIDMIEKKELFECRPIGDYHDYAKYSNILEKEAKHKDIIIKTQRDKIDRLQKELDFLQDTGNRKEGESLGVRYSSDMLTEEAKESIKKQFAEMFPMDIDFKIVDHKESLIQKQPYRVVCEAKSGDIKNGKCLICGAKIDSNNDIICKNKPQAPEDRIVNQSKKPVPPKPMNN